MAVRPGIQKLKSESQAERLRQFLYLNPEIIPKNSFPLGVERNSYFRNWSCKGFNSIADLRSDDLSCWLDTITLQQRTRSKHTFTLITRVRDATEDWDLSLPESRLAGMWLRGDEPHSAHQFYHLIRRDGDGWLAYEYFRSPTTEQLFRFDDTLVNLPSGDFTEARIIIRSKAGAVQKFNPKDPVDPSFETWTYRSGKITELDFDPKEWRWRRQGIIKPGNFFEYSTKRGYRIIQKTHYRQLKFDKWMEDCGYSDQQRKSFFKRLWHPWLPRKVSSMVWLTIAEGLHLGDWRRRIGHSGICPLCNGNQLQTAEHGLFYCSAVRVAWEKLRHLLSLAGSPIPLVSWHDALYGELGRPRARGPGLGSLNPDDDISWDTGSPCSINRNTPWHIIRCTLLWYIWCQHCSHDLQDGSFHIGVALYKSWQCTVQVGMAAWRQLQKFKKKRDPSKHAEMEASFTAIWCQADLFCSDVGSKPKWHPTPHREFLPRALANRYSSARIDRTVPAQDDTTTSEEDSLDLP